MGKLTIAYEDLKAILVNAYTPKGKHWVALFDKVDSLEPTTGMVSIDLSSFYLDGMDGNYKADHGIPVGATILGSYFASTTVTPSGAAFIEPPLSQEATGVVAGYGATYGISSTKVSTGTFDPFISFLAEGSLVIDYTL